MVISPPQIVRQARVAKSLNQQSFGRLVGRTQSVISKYESGHIPVPSEVLIQCMNILEMAHSDAPTVDDVVSLTKAVASKPNSAELRHALATLLKFVSQAP